MGLLAGIYNGLIIRTNAPSYTTSGYLNLTLNPRGFFTATLRMSGVSYYLNGKFDAAGHATTTVRRQRLAPLQVTMSLDLANRTEQITGTVSDGVFTSTLLINRVVYIPSNLARTYPGAYTMLLSTETNNPTAWPQGDGYGLMMVSSNGLIRINGSLGDGNLLTQYVPLSKHGTWPVYQELYNGRGCVLGWLSFTNDVGICDFEGSLYWFKPPVAGDPYYPAGFNTEITVVGSRYANPPVWGTSLLKVSNTTANATITLGDGNLVTPLTIPVTYSANNTVTVSGANPYRVAVTVLPATGNFVGSFMNPNTSQSCSFTGTVLQIQNYAAGYFRGNNVTGYVVLEPNP
jgi:hypothetical protein